MSQAHDRNSRAKSCTACRQVKLKCDAAVTFPAACSRCKTKGLDCRRDNTFKRIPTRHRLEEVTSKLSNLEKAVKLGHLTTASNVAGEVPPLSRAILQPQLGASEHISFNSFAGAGKGSTYHGNLSDNGQWIDLQALEKETPPAQYWTLGETTVTSETLISLFKHFERHYYHHLPILEKVHSVSTLHQSSPFLFWTIVICSAGRHPTHKRLGAHLLPSYEGLLFTNIGKPIHSIQTVHAILLLCLWPLPVFDQSDDPSWNYVGLAMNAAMHLGLHLNCKQDLFGYEEAMVDDASMDVRNMTWMACAQISTQISCFVGLPPHLSSTPQLDHLAFLCRTTTRSRSFAAETEIQRHVTRYMGALDGPVDPLTQQSLIHLFDQELEAIRSNFQDGWSSELEMSLQSAKIYLYALCFIYEGSQVLGDFGVHKVSYSMILRSGLRAAARLVHLFDEVTTLPQGHGSFATWLPKYHFRNLAFSATFLLTFVAAFPDAAESDKDLAINSVTLTYQIFCRLSPSGQSSRTGQTIELLGRMQRSGASQVTLHVKSRFGASLLYNALRAAKKIRNRQKSASTQPSPNEEVLSPRLVQAHEAQVPQFTDNGVSPFEHSGQPDLSQEFSFPWGLWDRSADALFDTVMLGEAYGGYQNDIQNMADIS